MKEMNEKEEIQDLKEELADYEEDIKDLNVLKNVDVSLQVRGCQFLTKHKYISVNLDL